MCTYPRIGANKLCLDGRTRSIRGGAHILQNGAKFLTNRSSIENNCGLSYTVASEDKRMIRMGRSNL